MENWWKRNNKKDSALIFKEKNIFVNFFRNFVSIREQKPCIFYEDKIVCVA